MTNRIIIALLVITALLQGVILYKGYRGTSNTTPAAQAPVRDASKGAMVDLDGLTIEGQENAKIILIEFSDYQCPFCQRHATSTAKQLHEQFVSTGKIRHAFVNNPLPIHPQAKLLATASICAGQQKSYWSMSERLFRDTPTSGDSVVAVAKALNMDLSIFQSCLNGPEPEQLKKDMKMAEALDLASTPSFAVGRIDAAKKVHVEKIIVGAQPFQIFEKVINEEVQKAAAL
jgi:protein-disulfide isomerase